ncbi:hypothetical protein BDP27DRAFT_1340744 [Rhodocollybia butyracea]|uniref:Uncharacterized protein n=1 Tax=Rhodocollybia butyracea TaxID=206335 RepID=A0A9P5PCW9_9AGAR|nr:hypothetical protein BDP27DRAFT_1340744 [Rhodocollybia butyracea]
MLISLSLTLSYGGAKALLTEGSFEYIITVIREDCLTLKLDQPASDNIKVTGPGRVEFSWLAHKDGTLHRSLEMKFKPTSPSSILKTDPERLCGLSMCVCAFFRRERKRKRHGGTWTRDISQEPSKSRTPALPDHRESNNSTLNTGHQTPPPTSTLENFPAKSTVYNCERSNLTVCPPCLFNSLSRYK